MESSIQTSYSMLLTNFNYCLPDETLTIGFLYIILKHNRNTIVNHYIQNVIFIFYSIVGKDRVKTQSVSFDLSR